MKTIIKLSVLFAGISLAMSCSESDDFLINDSPDNVLKSTSHNVSVPFKTNPFDFTYLYVGPGSNCSEDQPLQVVAEGTGTATHLGYFSTHVEFCCNEEMFNPDRNIVGSFVAANGDELFYSTWGSTGPPNPDDPPEILERWEAEFVFAGGTGRFKEATGSGTYYGYNYLVEGVPNGVLCKAIFEGMILLAQGNH